MKTIAEVNRYILVEGYKDKLRKLGMDDFTLECLGNEFILKNYAQIEANLENKCKKSVPANTDKNVV